MGKRRVYGLDSGLDLSHNIRGMTVAVTTHDKPPTYNKTTGTIWMEQHTELFSIEMKVISPSVMDSLTVFCKRNISATKAFHLDIC